MEAHEVLLQLFLILVSARIFAELFAQLQMPPVLGEVLAGILLGPSLLGWVQVNDLIRLLAEIGIILLLFEIGLETDMQRLRAQGSRALTVAVMGALAPFALGFAASYWLFGWSVMVSLFVGGTLTATSIGITLRVLKDLGQAHTDSAQVVIGAAVLDDVLGVVLLVLLADFAISGQVSWENALRVVGMIALFFAVAPLLAASLSRLIHVYDSRWRRVPGFMPTIIVSLILFFAWLAHLMGAPEIVGAFAAGVALSRRFFLPFGLALKADPVFVDKLEGQMRPLIHLFTPIFFVTVGLSVDLTVIDFASTAFWGPAVLLLVLAVVGKLAGAFLLRDISMRARWQIGVSMVPRGEVGLIFAELGRSVKVFGNELYAVLIFVIILTTLVPPFVLKRLFGRL